MKPIIVSALETALLDVVDAPLMRTGARVGLEELIKCARVVGAACTLAAQVPHSDLSALRDSIWKDVEAGALSSVRAAHHLLELRSIW